MYIYECIQGAALEVAVEAACRVLVGEVVIEGVLTATVACVCARSVSLSLCLYLSIYLIWRYGDIYDILIYT